MSRHVRSFGPVMVVLSFLLIPAVVQGAGFGLYEGSARGNALGGATIAQGDDASVIFYNPAQMSELPGLQLQAGATFIQPSVEIDAAGKTTKSEDNTWIPPHLYATYQVNNKVWAGFGLYSRFGLGTEFDEKWVGKYNSYNAVIETLTANPNIALKLSDKVTVAAGLNAMYFDMKLERKLPPALTGAPSDLDLSLTGDSIGYGFDVAAFLKVNDWASIGVAYQSRVDQEIEGEADIGLKKTDASGDITLPDEIFMGVAFKPTEKLSLEVGAVCTAWSTYDELKIKFDDASVLGTTESTTPKNWKDAMRYQVGAEYSLTDALDLRVGYCYDMSPLNDATLDYLVPADDRQLFSFGFGYDIKSWTLDLSYTYLMLDDLHIPARMADGVLESDAKKGDAHMLGVSLSTKI